MKTLLLLRHAKSNRDEPQLPDHDRPLSARGLKDASRMGGFIFKEGLNPDLILSSTAKRAQDTAKLVAKHSRYKGIIELNKQLYETNNDILYKILVKIPEKVKSVMLVGHNPDFELFLKALTNKTVELSTCSLVKISLDIPQWGDLNQNTKATLDTSLQIF